MVTVEGDELTTLQDNTWGLALDNEPEAKDNKVYTVLSTDQDNPTIIKTIDDYSETPANDTTSANIASGIDTFFLDFMVDMILVNLDLEDDSVALLCFFL